MYDLLLHFLVVHNKNMFASTFNRSSSNHIKADSVSNSHGVSGADVVMLHTCYQLYDLLSVYSAVTIISNRYLVNINNNFAQIRS